MRRISKLLAVLSVICLLVGCQAVTDSFNSAKESFINTKNSILENEQVKFVIEKYNVVKDYVVEHNPFKKKPEPIRIPRPPVVYPEVDYANGRTVINYACLADKTGTLRAIIDSFNLENSEFYVNLTEFDYDDYAYHSLLKNYTSSNIKYDVFDIDLNLCAEFAISGLIAELDTALYTMGISPQNYYAMDGAIYKGRTYGIPKEINLGAIFVKSGTFDYTPSTWDELISYSTQAKDTGFFDKALTFGGVISPDLTFKAYEMVYSYGGRIFDANGNLDIDNKEFREALTMFRKLYNLEDEKEKSRILVATNDDAANYFLDEKILYMRNEPSYWDKCDEVMRGGFSIAPLPKGSFSGSDLIRGKIICMSSETPYRDYSLELIRYLTGNVAQKQMALSGKVPALKMTLRDSAVLIKYPLYQSDAFSRLLLRASIFTQTTNYSIFGDIFRQHLSYYIYYDRSLDQMIENIISDYEKLTK